MKRNDTAVILAAFAHALTWVVALFLVFGPVYQGVSMTAVTPGGGVSESTRFTATLIGVNGLRVLPILLVPVALTGLALLAVLRTDAGQVRQKVLVWVPAVLLLAFCILGSFSIGIFYLPSGLALVLSAIFVSLSRGGQVRAG